MDKASDERRQRVVICICTYRRPRELERLLESVGKLQFAKIAEPLISIVVVENDTAALAKGVCEKHQRLLRWPLRYAIEEKPGISRARNRCLSLVEEKTDFVVFVDDDETVSDAWLENLLYAQRCYGADVIAGPVLPVYETTAPEWTRNGEFHGYHSRKRWQSGMAVDECSTCNVLITVDFLRNTQLKFNEDFGLSGGEDVLFFRTANRQGAKIMWCGEAVAHEYVPSSRVSLLWLFERTFRIGTTNVNIVRMLDGKCKALTTSAWRGLTRLGVGIVFLPIAILRGRASTTTALCRVAYGLGSIFGGLGYRHQVYKRKTPP